MPSTSTVMSCFAYLVVGVSLMQTLVCAPGSSTGSVPCMCTHLPHTHHTLQHLPSPRQSRDDALCCLCLLLNPRAWLLYSSPFNSLAHKVSSAPGTLKLVSAFSFWMFSGRWRRRKHVCELDVPWMFNQERQNCRGARGWIGRCGLPRPPPSVLRLPAEPLQLPLPAPPPGLGRWPCPACPICATRMWGGGASGDPGWTALSSPCTHLRPLHDLLSLCPGVLPLPM